MWEKTHSKIESIVKSYDAKIGFSSLGFENEFSHSFNGNVKFPMQSVYKFHLALTALRDVDQNKLSLDQEILITENDIAPDYWSPIKDKFPQANVNLRLKELLFYMISESDNVACDILFRIVGGPKRVNSHIAELEIDDVCIVNTEAQIQSNWELQFENYTTPNSAVKLLKLFFGRKILSDQSTDFLLDLMLGTKTGRRRIKGLLPDNTLVAHKTGYSGKNEIGTTAACNDIGIVTLPDKSNFAIAVFVSNSKHELEQNEEIVARIAKVIWDRHTL